MWLSSVVNIKALGNPGNRRVKGIGKDRGYDYSVANVLRQMLRSLSITKQTNEIVRTCYNVTISATEITRQITNVHSFWMASDRATDMSTICSRNYDYQVCNAK